MFRKQDPPAKQPMQDRRTNRFIEPGCPECHGALTVVADRTDASLCLRCENCSYVWTAPKPRTLGPPR
jgi:hypothetical protein